MSKTSKPTVVYFFVNSKRKIECRNCKHVVWLDEPQVNHKGIDIDVTDAGFTTGSITEFEKHVKAHKTRKDKIYPTNIKEVKAFFKRLA